MRETSSTGIGPNAIEVRLVQVKAGVAGLKTAEIARLKKGRLRTVHGLAAAAYDGATLHLMPDVPSAAMMRVTSVRHGTDPA